MGITNKFKEEFSIGITRNELAEIADETRHHVLDGHSDAYGNVVFIASEEDNIIDNGIMVLKGPDEKLYAKTEQDRDAVKELLNL